MEVFLEKQEQPLRNFSFTFRAQLLHRTTGPLAHSTAHIDTGTCVGRDLPFFRRLNKHKSKRKQIVPRIPILDWKA